MVEDVTGRDLKEARLKTGLTQAQAADALGVTQAYLSMLERGRREVSAGLLMRARQLMELRPTSLPLEAEPATQVDSNEFKAELGALGYPGFRYLVGKPAKNPAQLVFEALGQSDLDARVVEALPWLAANYELDWKWLVPQAKKHDRQNRLGFLVELAKELATKRQDDLRADKLAETQEELERGRLVREDTLCHESMTNAERRWLRQNRPESATHWNLLTDLQLDNLSYVA